MIEVTAEFVTGIPAIQSDSLYVFDQWCIARGQSESRGYGDSQTSLSIKRPSNGTP